ncbi:GIY-YIG nuclease family protein [Streptomyces sp. NPDC046866]|uniref:GIY-YIG nuclease family protein n=1 Tax=Streptomyces sp. NPDC046866 TaxID=3154921 RepID=UPI003454F862
MTERTALYRLFAADGELLYVGITNDTATRWSYHARQKAWWVDVANRTVEWHEGRPAAARAEAIAIRAERPRWNVIQPNEDGKFAPVGSGRPATGRTPKRNIRVADDLWEAAKVEAAAEGRPLTDVILGNLHRYVNRRRRERGAAGGESRPFEESDNTPK